MHAQLGDYTIPDNEKFFRNVNHALQLLLDNEINVMYMGSLDQW